VIGDADADDLATVTTAWSDQWFDHAAALLWNPPGSFGGVIADRSVHLIPQSAWYAVGCLQRGDVDRGVRVIEAILDAQYDQPGEIWHGTFSRFLEWPEPPADAIEWDDYDPNWRQFVGTTWLVILRHFEGELPGGLVDRIERSMRLAIEGEPADRVAPWYTNIALMKAVLGVEAGHRLHEPAWVDGGHALAEAVVARRERKGAFDEFNSPTYYGIDFLGLALWRSCPVSARLRSWGASTEAALWAETALLYHADLGNLCGPYTRSYGMDLHRYVGALSLWLWPAVGSSATPLPDLASASIDHGHDLCLGPVVALLGTQIPEAVRPWFVRFPGASTVERLVGERPRRVVTAWLDDDRMIGAEDCEAGWPAWHQYFPATVHWRAGGGIGSIRLVHNGPARARASANRLSVDCSPSSDGSDPTFLVEVDGLDPRAVTARRWRLPFLDVSVDTDTDLVEVAPFGPGRHLAVYRLGAGSGRFVLGLGRAHPA
jgi:hypothetical protein